MCTCEVGELKAEGQPGPCGEQALWGVRSVSLWPGSEGGAWGEEKAGPASLGGQAVGGPSWLECGVVWVEGCGEMPGNWLGAILGNFYLKGKGEPMKGF